MKKGCRRGHCILVVDDEPYIRSNLYQVFQREGFDILLAENSEDAFQLLKKRRVSVVFSDYVMPGQSGLAFLREIKQRYPEIVRVFLSGQVDMATMKTAIHQKIVSYFLLKPWKIDILRKTLYHAIAQYEETSTAHSLTPQNKNRFRFDPPPKELQAGISAH
ncbi:MAG: response regulator [Nitrospiria bacterium]